MKLRKSVNQLKRDFVLSFTRMQSKKKNLHESYKLPVGKTEEAYLFYTTVMRNKFAELQAAR